MTLVFDHVRFAYGRFRAPVLNDFNWIVPSARTVLLGPNGAGKSTLLALGADAMQPGRGRIRFGGLDRASQRASFRRAIGWMPQQIRAVPGLTVREQVAYAGWLKGISRREAWDRTPRPLAMAGLEELANRPASHLSGGELRRLGIAQTLIHDAKILLLDEPTAGLDPAQRARFRELVAEISRDQEIVVSTHQVDDLSDLFDTVVVLEGGAIRHSSSVSDFLALGGTAGESRRAERAYSRVIGSAT